MSWKLGGIWHRHPKALQAGVGWERGNAIGWRGAHNHGKDKSTGAISNQAFSVLLVNVKKKTKQTNQPRITIICLGRDLIYLHISTSPGKGGMCRVAVGGGGGEPTRGEGPGVTVDVR